ncbi:hypothetical protein K466DRAFT_667450 [Polyporus arcularius HHB13444]|uniref:G-patch domain-containing protein n=1 Tax=Polyporus arcularius HHB13444 TaxID=1314778 RepID=A0A5C3NU82_9APHY|nr:hypothetical protein K466DRAFT_667450 [Polyporus arcularius HHB13444]
MPLDGHAHLVRQGWSGKGSGLRHGAIAKPVTIIQKKTLSGIGKDRDEAFPFWDHVFQAASVSIQLKLHDSDNESDEESSGATPAVELKRTSTGIISNRRPTTGTPALSGTNTPSDSLPSTSGSSTPRLNIMAAAKQQAARTLLYSMFYRGPVLTTEDEKTKSDESANVAQAGPTASSSASSDEESDKDEERQARERRKGKKRKAGKGTETDGDVDADKRERKRRKREEKEKKTSKAKGKERATEESDIEGDQGANEVQDVKAARAMRKAEKAERKRRRAEKRARKEEKRKRRAEREARVQDEDPDGEKDVDTSVASTPVPDPSELETKAKTSKRTSGRSHSPRVKKKAKQS